MPVHTSIVDKPKHYQIFPGEYEALDIIERLIEFCGLSAKDSYLYGNSLKYLLRLGRKDSTLIDLKKSMYYLKRLEGSL